MPGAKKDKYGLTDKQRRYAENRAAGMSQPDAYTTAGYSSKQNRNSQAMNACALEKLDPIKKHIQYLKDIAATGAMDTIEERRAALIDIYNNSTNEKNRLKALDMLNKMSGDYVERKEVSATVQGLTRDDRLTAMQDTLNSLKTAWDRLDGKD